MRSRMSREWSNKARTNERWLVVVIKGCVDVEFDSFSESGKKKMATEEIPAKGLLDEIPRNDFAARVLAAVEENLLGKIMSCAIRDSTDYILKKEITKLADDVVMFRKVLSTKMRNDESLDEGAPAQLERMRASFDAGWKEWKSAWDNREELVYRAFIEKMTSPEE